MRRSFTLSSPTEGRLLKAGVSPTTFIHFPSSRCIVMEFSCDMTNPASVWTCVAIQVIWTPTRLRPFSAGVHASQPLLPLFRSDCQQENSSSPHNHHALAWGVLWSAQLKCASGVSYKDILMSQCELARPTAKAVTRREEQGPRQTGFIPSLKTFARKNTMAQP